MIIREGSPPERDSPSSDGRLFLVRRLHHCPASAPIPYSLRRSLSHAVQGSESVSHPHPLIFAGVNGYPHKQEGRQVLDTLTAHVEHVPRCSEHQVCAPVRVRTSYRSNCLRRSVSEPSRYAHNKSRPADKRMNDFKMYTNTQYYLNIFNNGVNSHIVGVRPRPCAILCIKDAFSSLFNILMTACVVKLILSSLCMSGSVNIGFAKI